MDFLTHLVSGFLISYWISGSPFDIYVIFGTIMALFPDIDVFLKPLWEGLPITRHHGLTHTVIFIFVSSTIIYFLFELIMDFSDLRLLFLMCFIGVFHIFLDFLGTGGVNPFHLYTKTYSKLNIDIGVNPLLGLYSLISIIILASIIFNYVALIELKIASIIIGCIYLLYFCGRAILKIYYEEKPENRGFTALPTIIPNKWRLVKRIDRVEGFTVFIKTAHGLCTYEIPKARKEIIDTCEDLVYTYWHPLVQDRMRIFKFPYYRINHDTGNPEIIWNSAEMGRVMDVTVLKLDRELKVDVKFNRSRKGYLREMDE